MLRGLLRLLACGLLGLVLVGTPAVRAQNPAPAANPGGETEQGEKSTSALPYAVFFLFTILILMIVCMPSRKA